MPADAAGLVRLRLGGEGLLSTPIPRTGSTRLQAMYQHWPFFRTLLSNMDMVLAKSSLAIASRYAQLVPDVKLREEIFSRISQEWRDSIDALNAIMGQQQLLESNPLLLRSIRNRFPYLDPLNHVQVELLKLHRAHAASEKVLTGIQLTINGISAGLTEQRLRRATRLARKPDWRGRRRRARGGERARSRDCAPNRDPCARWGDRRHSGGADHAA